MVGYNFLWLLIWTQHLEGLFQIEEYPIFQSAQCNALSKDNLGCPVKNSQKEFMNTSVEFRKPKICTIVVSTRLNFI